ncbi:amino acid ABC transporter substrate-binding protein, PAAT family [Duganella sp. CF517]|uniref:substrate-binding periplasmic protein n=1 Tax=Duganella sp. CF517 TaxID=1881038 RepID=UPI0008D44F2A|nr:transporter substrate-binding domain-containing protein [Duganella sp. CF517]SEO09261.1 amino acid ABC transporter substrate-binding protein, PAAT family [Duganella sp. CF517]
MGIGRRWRGAVAVLALAWLVGVSGANASGPAPKVRLIAADTAIFCSEDERRPGAPPAGLVCDMLRDMARRVGHAGPIELYPFQRAIMLAAAGPAVLMAPLARTPAREASYQWLVQLFEEEFVVVAKRDSGVDISTLDKVAHLHVGLVREGVAAELALQQRWPDLQLSTRDIANARKLDRGRIDAWVGPWNGILAFQRAAGLPVANLRRGAVLKRVQVYLAASRDLDPAVGAAWKKAFDDMVRDGTYRGLLRRYAFEPPARAAP